MIDKLDLHYAFTNPASIHDEEALTALELAGRQGAKINEVVNSQNQLVADTDNKIALQNKVINEGLNDIDKAIATVPTETQKEFQRQMVNGNMGTLIETEVVKHTSELETQVENLP